MTIINILSRRNLMKKIIEKIKSQIKHAINVIKSNEGFSLLELLIVIVIIGILGTIVYTRFSAIPETARFAAAKMQIRNFELPLIQFNSDNDGRFPTTEEGLDAIKGYLKEKKVPKDPWGSNYVYKCPGDEGREYDIISIGPDKQENTADDIKSWDLESAGKKAQKDQ